MRWRPLLRQAERDWLGPHRPAAPPIGRRRRSVGSPRDSCAGKQIVPSSHNPCSWGQLHRPDLHHAVAAIPLAHRRTMRRACARLLHLACAKIILTPNSFTQCVEPKPRGGWAFAAPGQLLRERRGALTDSRPGRRTVQLCSPSLISSPRRRDHLRALQPLYLLFCQLATSPQPSLQRPSGESFSPQMAGRP